MSARKLRWRKDGRTNISVEEACWQYLLDHAKPSINGGLYIRIYLPSYEEFIRRLQVRIKGKYRFTEEEVLSLNLE